MKGQKGNCACNLCLIPKLVLTDGFQLALKDNHVCSFLQAIRQNSSRVAQAADTPANVSAIEALRH